ncbi:sodium:solute symporter family protein [Priestia megaterium]|uniref:sodium:solute symporter family protein n=1 Tax=Priestia megaterium TaxID=1404 RepID=UPI00272FD96D|nr:sodium:solute symporter family protein [Priestia megaterium]MDP1442135.1 sodium:solute symporter family protein [Priestia megaterium]MDP1471088.1 sodium:solute symporter family protein [Priestia megaterium]
MNISLTIMIAFVVVCMYWAIKAGRGKNENMEEWALGGRGMGAIITFFLLAGEFFTAFSLTGLVGLAYNSGIATLYIMSYISIACIIGYFLLPKIRRYGKAHKLISQGEFFEKKYASPFLGKLITIVGMIAIVPTIVMALKGLGLIVSVASYGAISSATAIWVGSVIVVIYTLISGLHGSSRVALIKDILTFGVLLFLGLYFPFHYHDGIGSMIKEVAEVKPKVLLFPNTGLSLVWFISTIVLMSLGLYIWPYTFLSTYAAKSDKAIRKNTIIMPLYSLMQLFSCFIGLAAILTIPNLAGAESDLALIQLVFQTFNPWFVGLIGAAGLLASLVPCSVMLITIGSMITSNIYMPLRPHTSSHKQMNIARSFAIVAALISLYLALNSNGALVLLQLISYNFIIQLFPALIFSLMKKNFVTKQGAISGIVIGLSLALFSAATDTTMAMLFPNLPSFILDINNGLYMLIINAIVTVVISLVTQNFVTQKSTKENDNLEVQL